MRARHPLIAALALASACFLVEGSRVQAATTIDLVNKYAYAANVGWIDWTGGINQTATGANIGAYVCSNYIYSANVGWINLGTGSPANGIYYSNTGNDWGVNMDGYGNLTGYAWGANIGWINFANIGVPAVDMITGAMSGSVWSANCGWLSLTNSYAFVQTDTISPGALDPDGSGLPIAWELQNFGVTGVNSNSDPTGKGMTVKQDYIAGTDPNNPASLLKITSESFAPGGTSATLTWNSVATRYYYIEETLLFSPTNWITNTSAGFNIVPYLGLISSQGASTTVSLTDTSAGNRFYRVKALRPLTQ